MIASIDAQKSHDQFFESIANHFYALIACFVSQKMGVEKLLHRLRQLGVLRALHGVDPDLDGAAAAAPALDAKVSAHT